MMSVHVRKPGFSFIELVVVVTIIVLLAAVAIPGYYAFVKRVKKSTTISTLQTTHNAIDANFYADTGSYPNNLSELVNRPADEKIGKRWEGPYLTKEPEDGYKHELVYRVTKGGKHPYELYSWGPNGEGSPESEWISVWDI